MVFIFQYSKLDSVYKFLTIVIYVAMALVEVTRLYLGYAGNLQEKVFKKHCFFFLFFYFFFYDSSPLKASELLCDNNCHTIIIVVTCTWHSPCCSQEA